MGDSTQMCGQIQESGKNHRNSKTMGNCEGIKHRNEKAHQQNLIFFKVILHAFTEVLGVDHREQASSFQVSHTTGVSEVRSAELSPFIVIMQC